MKSVQMILSVCYFGALMLAGSSNNTDCTKYTTSDTCYATSGCYWNAPASGVGPSACLAATACSQLSGASKTQCEANTFNSKQCAYTAAAPSCAVSNCVADSTKTYCCVSGAACTATDTVNCTATGSAGSVTCASVAKSCQVVKGTTATTCCVTATCATANTSDAGCAAPGTIPASCN